jgi:DNA-binding CsgD family transcriptional regulator
MSKSMAAALPGPRMREARSQRAKAVSEDEVVRKLARSLIRRVADLADADAAGRNPLLDLTELGVRCLLVPVVPQAHDLLSPREHEIARMVGKGHTNKEIAGVLDISLYTVSAHMRRIFSKLGVGTRAAMVAALNGENMRVG